MKKIVILTVLVALFVSGCASQQHYNQAFSEQTRLTNNSRIIQAPPAKVFQLAKRTLITQGFTIENADANSGLIKATRILHDADDKEVSYNINLSTDITEMSKESASVTVAASQQTVLHRKWHTWWKLLWIVPLFPTGTEYQTVVTKEGNITDQKFYRDLFEALLKNLDAEKETVAAK